MVQVTTKTISANETADSGAPTRQDAGVRKKTLRRANKTMGKAVMLYERECGLRGATDGASAHATWPAHSGSEGV